MGRITVSEGLERLRKWATRNAKLLVIDADINNNAPGETLARIAVTESNELEVSAGGKLFMKDTLDGAKFSELPETASSKFVDTLEVKFHDGKWLAFREPRQLTKGE